MCCSAKNRAREEAERMKFRKKPVVIDAVQFAGHVNGHEVVDWITGGGGEARYIDRYVDPNHPDEHVLIVTLEGTMCADIRDWIIKGVKGEFYPCKPDIFAATYEADTVTAV